MATKTNPRIFLSAGEASGDHYGAELILALRAALPSAKFTGLGGPEMEAAGQQRVIRAEDVAAMGITEILRHIPRIYASYRRLVRSIRTNKPDVAVLIDFPDVNFRLAKHLHRMGVPVLWFVSPQLWAWKRRRLRWVQQRVSQMFVIFPFEETFYQQRGVRAVFTGHPLADLPAPTVAREEYARAYGLDAAKPWIALLPGSRGKEVEANLPEMLQAARMLGGAYEFLLPVAPTLSEDFLAGFTGGTGVQLVRDARAALHHARASVVASGTATVQAALLGNPFVVVYRVSALTFWLAKRLVRYPAEMGLTADEHGNLPIAMPNLIAGRRIVPELINRQMTAPGIVSRLLPLLADGPKRAAQMRDLAELRQRMAPSDGRRAIDLLRDAVLESIGTASASSRV